MDFSWIWMILAAETGALDDQTLDGPGCESFFHKTMLKIVVMMITMALMKITMTMIRMIPTLPMPASA